MSAPGPGYLGRLDAGIPSLMHGMLEENKGCEP